jgi:hypothetical protein
MRGLRRRLPEVLARPKVPWMVALGPCWHESRRDVIDVSGGTRAKGRGDAGRASPYTTQSGSAKAGWVPPASFRR